MKAVKYLVCLVALFLISCAAIIYGYYNPILGLRGSIELAFEKLPILLAATLVTLSCPVSLVVSFRKYPDDYHNFSGLLIALSLTFSFAVIFFVLPHAGLHLAPLGDDHFSAMYLALWFSLYGACRWLQLDFWRFARREA